MKLGDALKGWRAIQTPSIGIREAARQIGVSPTTLSKVENGHMPDAATLQAIWGFLTVPDTSHNAEKSDG